MLKKKKSREECDLFIFLRMKKKLWKSGIYFNVNWIRYVKVSSFLGIGCHCGDLEALDASRFGTRLRHLWTCLSSIKHLYTFFNGHILYPIHGVSLSFFCVLKKKQKGLWANPCFETLCIYLFNTVHTTALFKPMGVMMLIWLKLIVDFASSGSLTWGNTHCM